MTLDASLVVLLPRFLIRVDVSDLSSVTTYGQWVLKTRVQPLARYFGAFCGTFLRRGEPLACWPSNSGDRELNTQHFAPASNDRMHKLGNHLHAAGTRAQADVCHWCSTFGARFKQPHG